MTSRNDMWALAEQTKASQDAINDLVEHAHRPAPPRCPVCKSPRLARHGAGWICADCGEEIKEMQADPR